MKHKHAFAILISSTLVALTLTAGNVDVAEDQSGEGRVIISRYLQATQADSISSNNSKNGPLEVEIEASVPKLNEHGHLRATRKISSIGKISYHVLGFQGDSNVKNQVIARYLQAEQQGQDDKSLTLSPENYKFRLKSERTAGNGVSVYVFQVTPRKKRVGLFKGEVWLDARTYLPVFEKGRLVKNPSVFFRQVDFEREFSISNGSAIPARMSSVIDTRIVGKVNLSVAYSSPAAAETAEVAVEDSVAANPIIN